MKKSLSAALGILCAMIFLVIFCVWVVLWFNPNLNIFKIKSVEKNALEYINQTYPGFTVTDIDVHHEWKSNHYVVNYSDGKGNSRTVIFDHTGKDIFSDEYINKKSMKIIYTYEASIEQKVDSILQSIPGGYYIDYISIDDEHAYGKEREIVLEGLDISKDAVTCTVGLVRFSDTTTKDLAEIYKKMFEALSASNLPIEKIEFSASSTFRLKCPENMGEMSIDEIEMLIKK